MKISQLGKKVSYGRLPFLGGDTGTIADDLADQLTEFQVEAPERQSSLVSVNSALIKVNRFPIKVSDDRLVALVGDIGESSDGAVEEPSIPEDSQLLRMVAFPPNVKRVGKISMDDRLAALVGDDQDLVITEPTSFSDANLLGISELQHENSIEYSETRSDGREEPHGARYERTDIDVEVPTQARLMREQFCCELEQVVANLEINVGIQFERNSAQPGNASVHASRGSDADEKQPRNLLTRTSPCLDDFDDDRSSDSSASVNYTFASDLPSEHNGGCDTSQLDAQSNQLSAHSDARFFCPDLQASGQHWPFMAELDRQRNRADLLHRVHVAESFIGDAIRDTQRANSELEPHCPQSQDHTRHGNAGCIVGKEQPPTRACLVYHCDDRSSDSGVSVNHTCASDRPSFVETSNGDAIPDARGVDIQFERNCARFEPLRLSFNTGCVADEEQSRVPKSHIHSFSDHHSDNRSNDVNAAHFFVLEETGEPSRNYGTSEVDARWRQVGARSDASVVSKTLRVRNPNQPFMARLGHLASNGCFERGITIDLDHVDVSELPPSLPSTSIVDASFTDEPLSNEAGEHAIGACNAVREPAYWFIYGEGHARRVSEPHASESAILKSSYINTHTMERLFGDVPCSICLDMLRGKVITITSCGHIYHKQCLDTYLGDRCPQCRHPLDDQPRARAGVSTDLVNLVDVVDRQTHTARMLTNAEDMRRHDDDEFSPVYPDRQTTFMEGTDNDLFFI